MLSVGLLIGLSILKPSVSVRVKKELVFYIGRGFGWYVEFQVMGSVSLVIWLARLMLSRSKQSYY
jgi:hypothetical protein